MRPAPWGSLCDSSPRARSSPTATHAHCAKAHPARVLDTATRHMLSRRIHSRTQLSSNYQSSPRVSASKNSQLVDRVHRQAAECFLKSRDHRCTVTAWSQRRRSEPNGAALAGSRNQYAFSPACTRLCADASLNTLPADVSLRMCSHLDMVTWTWTWTWTWIMDMDMDMGAPGRCSARGAELMERRHDS